MGITSEPAAKPRLVAVTAWGMSSSLNDGPEEGSSPSLPQPLPRAATINPRPSAARPVRAKIRGPERATGEKRVMCCPLSKKRADSMAEGPGQSRDARHRVTNREECCFLVEDLRSSPSVVSAD